MRIILITAICLLCGTLNAQVLNEQEFVEKLTTTYEFINDNYNKSGYKQCENALSDCLASYEKMNETDAKNCKGYLSNMWYNLSCIRALRGNKKGAIDAFEKAVAVGYNNHNHALNDSDLKSIINDKRMQTLVEKIRKDNDFVNILRESNPYAKDDAWVEIPKFTYQNPNDSNLVRVRDYFNLDSIAGSGNELSKIKNLLAWVHDEITHDGNSYNPENLNAIDIYEICKKENRGVNCRCLSIMLNEMYLAMGFKSRYVTCMPKTYVSDCHVINAVYSNTLDKWVWVDPTQNAYVLDENGTMLSIAEVRERIINNQPLFVNDDANWNHKVKTTKEDYLDYYMAKNLYYVRCTTTFEFNQESEAYPNNVSLFPVDFEPKNVGKGIYSTTDDEFFWQSPYN